MTLGTVDYQAPEQALDFHRADIRADIYSLGCTFFYLLTGKPPFGSGPLALKLMRHQQATPPSLKERRADVPDELAADRRADAGQEARRPLPDARRGCRGAGRDESSGTPAPLRRFLFAAAGCAALLLLWCFLGRSRERSCRTPARLPLEHGRRPRPRRAAWKPPCRKRATTSWCTT